MPILQHRGTGLSVNSQQQLSSSTNISSSQSTHRKENSKIEAALALTTLREQGHSNADSKEVSHQNVANNERDGGNPDISVRVDSTDSMNFPEKLMEVLSNEIYTSIITWLPHGQSFIIYRRRKFVAEVLPRYFKQTKYTSFTRKLSRWGFTRITKGVDTGAYYHKLFLRGQMHLCKQMSCQSIALKFAGKVAPLKKSPAGHQHPTATTVISAKGHNTLFGQINMNKRPLIAPSIPMHYTAASLATSVVPKRTNKIDMNSFKLLVHQKVLQQKADIRRRQLMLAAMNGGVPNQATYRRISGRAFAA